VRRIETKGPSADRLVAMYDDPVGTIALRVSLIIVVLIAAIGVWFFLRRRR
jgi:hypothetical protein